MRNQTDRPKKFKAQRDSSFKNMCELTIKSFKIQKEFVKAL